MEKREVRTKEELKKAKEDKVDRIIVKGDLVKELNAAKKITTLSAGALAALTAFIGAGVAAAPFTAGTSLAISAVAAAPIAVTTGLSIPAIVLIAAVGVNVMIALFKEYTITFDLKNKTAVFEKKGNGSKKEEKNEEESGEKSK